LLLGKCGGGFTERYVNDGRQQHKVQGRTGVVYVKDKVTTYLRAAGRRGRRVNYMWSTSLDWETVTHSQLSCRATVMVPIGADILCFKSDTPLPANFVLHARGQVQLVMLRYCC
jgi:hypothetical protein